MMKRMIATTTHFMGQGRRSFGSGMAPRARAGAERARGNRRGPLSLAPCPGACLFARLHETVVAVFYPDAERKPVRCGDRIAQAAGARRPRPEARRRALYLHAVGAARDSEDYADLS